MSNKLAIIAIAILAVPLALYFVPYSYAASSNETTQVLGFTILSAGKSGTATATCPSGDYATGGGYDEGGFITITAESGIGPAPSGAYPPITQWTVDGTNFATVGESTLEAFVICQGAITVAGLGVPEFGQLYIAIALGALVFFLMGRYMTRNNKSSVTSTPITVT